MLAQMLKHFDNGLNKKNNMKLHLETLSIIAVIAAFVVGVTYAPSITLGVLLFGFLYAVIYAEILESEQKKKEQENDKG